MGKPLTAKRLRTLLDYSPETGLFTWKTRPSCRVRVGDVAGQINGDGYRRVRIGGKDFFANRLAILWVEGRHPAGQVRHINGNRSDNRWENLRQARPPRRRTSVGIGSPSHAAAE